jgi:hypothetical protein
MSGTRVNRDRDRKLDDAEPRKVDLMPLLTEAKKQQSVSTEDKNVEPAQPIPETPPQPAPEAVASSNLPPAPQMTPNPQMPPGAPPMPPGAPPMPPKMGFLQPRNLAASFLGSTLAEGAPDSPAAVKLKAEERVRREVIDPKHEGEMARIRARAMLNDFTSNDPVISTYGESEIADAFNQVAQLVPRASQEPAVMRGMLRKMLQQQDAMEPFEAEQLTSIETGLQRRDMPAVGAAGLNSVLGGGQMAGATR